MLHDARDSRYKIPMMSARHIATLLAALAAASCATYRLGPRPAGADDGEAGTPQRVAVETVATPAEWGMDAARLTRRLVDDLDARGVAARWTGTEEASATVHCSADGPPPTAFAAHRSAHVDVRCRVDGPTADGTVVTTKGSAASGAPAGADNSFGDAATAAMQEATADALERAVPRIADALARPDAPDGDS